MNIKKTVIVNTAIIAAVLAPLATCALDTDKLKNDIKEAPHDMATATKDAAITTKVKALFAMEPDIPSLRISVTTKDNVVHLDGKVDTALQAHKLIEIAQSVSGVRDVDDSKLKTESSEDFAKDAMITSKIKGKILQLANDGKLAKGYELHVETTNGNVHIFGKARNRQEVKRIESIAKNTENVNKVSTNIETKKNLR